MITSSAPNSSIASIVAPNGSSSISSPRASIPASRSAASVSFSRFSAAARTAVSSMTLPNFGTFCGHATVTWNGLPSAWAGLGVLLDGVDQRPARDRLVRDYQDPAWLCGHSLAPAPAATAGFFWGSLNTPCTAPGTPYS